ncbi:uncharacterized protein LOC143286310 [Babylonia areolata]|uniref:uncharacterized protein LOC143286310 n=1 Tax=Babylonia areolata TaxID=304850 RepID=UPI003FD3C2AB
MKSKKESKEDPIAADIPHYHTDDEAYLSNYRGYQGPSDGANGVPLSTISARSRENLNSSSTFIQERPSSYGLLSCLSAFFCCCPVGIAALCYSCKARCAKHDGDFEDARIMGRQARDIAIASVVLGVFLLLITVLIVILLWQTVGFDF